MLVFLLVAVTSGLLALGPVRRQAHFTPIKMFLYGWLLVEGAYVAHFVTYRVELHILSVMIVIASKVAFVIGGLAVGWLALPYKKNVSGHLKFDEFDKLVLVFFVALSAIAIILSAQSVLHSGVWLFDSDRFSGIRNQRWSDFYEGLLEVSPVRAAAGFGSFTLAILLPYFIRFGNPYLIVISVISCIVVAVDSLMAAGRFSIALLVVMIAVGIADRSSKMTLSALLNVRTALVGFVILVYFFIIFPSQRNPNLVNSVQSYLSWLSDAIISPWVLSVSSIAGFGWIPVFAYSTNYFSGSLDKLNYFLISTDVSTWYELGYYNFPVLSQIAVLLDVGENRWLEIRNNIALVMGDAGFASNPWATGIRDFVIDFGLIGCIFAAGILGFVFQYLFNRGRCSQSFCWKAIVLNASIGSFIFAFISPFQIRFIANGILALGCIVGIRAFLIAVLKLPKKWSTQ